MNQVEVSAFVQQEVEGRFKSITETTRADWVRAVWKSGDIETARRIVRELVDDPEQSLSVKNFYRKLKPAHAGESRVESARYEPWVQCLEAPADHPTWAGREWLRMDKFRRSDCTDQQYVSQYAHDVAKAIEQVYGGLWVGVVRPEGQMPPSHPKLWGADAKAWAEQNILDDPDGPGRRFLLARPKPKGERLVEQLANALPVVSDVKRDPVVATREMIDRLRNTPPAGQGPKAFDPNDPELIDPDFAAACATRDPDDPDNY